MKYVTRWRMHSARIRLKESNATVAELALALGYESEPAFNKAFKRLVGVPPGPSSEGSQEKALRESASSSHTTALGDQSFWIAASEFY